MLGERPAPAVPDWERVSAIRAGWADGSPVSDDATAAAGLSTAVGEGAAAASVAARRGRPAATRDGSMVGTSLACARVAPPRANWLAGLAASADNDGCVRVAPLALGAVCRDMAAVEGPGLAVPAVCGPALAGTSPTVVTTFVTALAVLRLAVATAPALGATTGASIGAEPAAAERRTSVGVVGDCVAVEATCDGDGSPLAGAAVALSFACRRMAVLLGETSPARLVATTAPAADSAVAAVLGKLGAPERRVSVGAAVGLVEAVGPSRPSERAIAMAGCARSADRGSAAGMVNGWAAVTCVADRRIVLAADAASTAAAAAASLLGAGLGATAAAVVATSGRAVLRG